LHPDFHRKEQGTWTVDCQRR